MQIRNIIRSLLAIMLVVALIFMSGCAHKKRALYNPESIRTNSNDINHVKKAIKTALIEYSWIVDQELPGRFIVRQSRGRYQARATIDYDRSSVRIKYLDSRDLNYHLDGAGVARIHGRYNSWITNLERRIAVLLIN